VELERTIGNAPVTTQKIMETKSVDCTNILAYIQTLPMEYQPPLLKFCNNDLNAKNNSSSTPLTFIDSSDIKRAIPRSYSPTIAIAIGKNRERYGELKSEKGWISKYAGPIALILVLCIFVLILSAITYQWYQPREVAKDIVHLPKLFFNISRIFSQSA
jgi:hypothetical protein